MDITLEKYPKQDDWILCKKVALKTMRKSLVTDPTLEWKKSILRARHSPCRVLMFMFNLQDIPYYVSTHLARHVHATPFISSQRNDRQDKYDRNKAQQDSPVDMMWWMNAEELMVISNKRLCSLADETTRNIVETMCWLVKQKCPEFEDVLVPMCEYHNGICNEMFPCGRYGKNEIKK